MKECYVKCASNEQAQALRPYLVEAGFVDDKEWNDLPISCINDADCVSLSKEGFITLLDELISSLCNTPLLHTVPADADLAEAAKVIKELF